MMPLHVAARLRGPIALPGGPMALDGLLAAAVALRDQLPPILDGEPLPIEIPVAREPGGRFHLASFSVGEFESYETRYVNRRFPVEQAQAIGAPSIRTLRITSGPAKSYRLPLSVGHVEHDQLDWYAIGDAEAIRDLLDLVHYIGKKRVVGNGAVERWIVEPCETWEGFPVVRDGRALRPLPLDWPGLVEPETAYRGITYPYWHPSTRQLVAVP